MHGITGYKNTSDRNNDLVSIRRDDLEIIIDNLYTSHHFYGKCNRENCESCKLIASLRAAKDGK